MTRKMLYIRKADETFWARGEKRAADLGVSFSEYIGRLIRADVTKINTSSPVTQSELFDTLHRVVAELRERSEGR